MEVEVVRATQILRLGYAKHESDAKHQMPRCDYDLGEAEFKWLPSDERQEAMEPDL